MRTIDQFKNDRDQWNREAAKKQRIRKTIGWVAFLVVLVVVIIVGTPYVKDMITKAQSYSSTPSGENGGSK